MTASPFLLVASLVVLLFSSALNVAAAIKITNDLDKVSNLFCIEEPK